MKTEPRHELFSDVASQFERMEQPLNVEWMTERNVSLEELHALSGKIALILRGYVAMPALERAAFVTRGLFLPPEIEPAKTVLGERQADSSA